MKQYQCLLIDWDGTIANSVPLWIEAYKTLFSKYKIKAKVADIYEKAYGRVKGAQFFGIKDFETFNKELFLLVATNYATSPLFPKVKETLQTLTKKNIKICVVSSTQRKLINEALEYHKISRYITFLIAREDVEHIKPHPEAVEKALSLMACKKEAAVIVGDSDVDLVAGSKAGIDTIFFTPLKMQKSHTVDPTHTVKEFHEIINFFQA